MQVLSDRSAAGSRQGVIAPDGAGGKPLQGEADEPLQGLEAFAVSEFVDVAKVAQKGGGDKTT
jgi:hypothetical protein